EQFVAAMTHGAEVLCGPKRGFGGFVVGAAVIVRTVSALAGVAASPSATTLASISFFIAPCSRFVGSHNHEGVAHSRTRYLIHCLDIALVALFIFGHVDFHTGHYGAKRRAPLGGFTFFGQAGMALRSAR